MKVSDFGLWLLLACLWGSAFLAIAVALETLTPLQLVAGRLAVGAFALVVVLYSTGGDLRLGKRGWAIAAVVAATGNILPFSLISFAQQNVDSGLAALIMGIAPVVTIAIAPLVHHDEKLDAAKVIGATLGFSGLLLLVGPTALSGIGDNLIAQLALIGAALCYAATALFSRRFPYPIPLRIAAASALLGAVATGIYTAFASGYGDFSAFPTVLVVVYLGLGPTALASVIFFRLIPRIGAARLQQVNYAVLIIGSILGVVFLGERLSWLQLMAIFLITLAIYAVTHKRSETIGTKRH